MHNESRGNERFPNSKFAMKNGSFSFILLSRCNIPASFGLYVFCLHVGGSFLRVYIVNVGIPINSLKGMRINASIARYVRLPSRETLINCRVKCTYNSSARSYVYISTEIMKSLYIHNIVREINERQFQLRATQRLADTRPSSIG